LRASLEDLIDLAVQRTGPLASVEGPFDVVVLGWVSLSHLTDPDLHVLLFRAIRRLFPEAPVVASFLVQAAATPSAQRRPAPARYVMRALRGRAFAPALAYLPRAGVVYRFSRDEIVRLASAAGYDVLRLDTSRDGYAVFQPRVLAVHAE
jgi:hypothetical protein